MDSFDLDIARVGFQGDGLSADGHIVPLTLPGERVRVRVREGGGQAELLDILSPSPQRVTPPCPHYAACGGCARAAVAPG